MSSRARAAALAALVLAGAGALAGCGSSSSDSTTTAATTVRPLTSRVQTDIYARTTPVTVPTTVATEPDAGDEEGIRVPATFTATAKGLTPPTITVPPTFPIELRVRLGDGQAHELRFATKPAVTVRVAASGSTTVNVPGQRAGRYSVRIDENPSVPALVVLDDAGP